MRPPVALGQAPALDGVGHADPGRPCGEVARQVLAVGQQHLLAGDLGDARVQPDVHAALVQLRPGVLTQLGVERAEQRGRHLDQPDVDPGRIDVREGRGEDGAAQLGERAGQLHAGGPAAGHGDVEIAAVHAQSLEGPQEMIAQRDRIGAGVQGEGVLGRSLDAVVGGRHAGGDEEVVVAELQAVGELDPAGYRVDRGQLAMPEVRPVPPREAARRIGDVAGVQPGRGHLIEQRLERAVEVTVDQGHPQARAGEPRDGGQPGESRAADDHLGCVRVSLMSGDRPHLPNPASPTTLVKGSARPVRDPGTPGRARTRRTG